MILPSSSEMSEVWTELLNERRFAELEQRCKERYEELAISLGEEEPRAIIAKHDLAITYHYVGRLDEALTQWEQLDTLHTKLGMKCAITLNNLDLLCGAYLSRLRIEEASIILERIKTEYENSIELWRDYQLPYWLKRSIISRRNKHFDNALSEAFKALHAVAKSNFYAENKEAKAFRYLAEVYYDMQQYTLAEKILKKALKFIYDTRLISRTVEMAIINEQLAMIALKRPSRAEAIKYAKSAVELIQLWQGPNDPSRKRIERTLANIQRE
jgi:tetratricopeptide (TPR) repeat protein